ncbi:MAG: FKBP-type peptidyl-prolyl cis-trans isomerase [Alistipes sp.]|jgi:FKBP-type peptidyl-prolyl cis-trans isomerase FkpA|nr:FKBP-type peptidyl-prolyl cis-trans isomerase [Alistipes sp.]
MKKLLLVAVVFGSALASCTGSKNIKSFSETDSLAYAIGIDYGSHAKRLDSTMNASVIYAAIQDVLANKPQMTQEESYAFLNEWFSVRVPAKNKAEAAAWLEEVKAENPNIKTTESGLMYEVIAEGDAAVKAVNDNDQVMVNYKGTLKNGTQFDANDSLTFALNRVIKGWTEGMKLVGKGGTVHLWIPAELGYGERGSGAIPPNAALKFEVDLLDVIPAAPVEEVVE